MGRCLKFFYYITIVSAFCANMLVVSQTTVLSVLGAGLALRGPDGSMMTATDGLYEERTSVFAVFGIGLACTFGSVLLCVWLILHWEAALVCMGITLITCRKVYMNYRRVCTRFDYDESETVDFKDIFDGAANIHTYRQKPRRIHSKKKSTPDVYDRRHKTQQHHHHKHSHNSLDHGRSSPTSSEDDNEMELMVPRNINSRSKGVQRRAVSGYSSTASQDSFGEYPKIQTV